MNLNWSPSFAKYHIYQTNVKIASSHGSVASTAGSRQDGRRFKTRVRILLIRVRVVNGNRNRNGNGNRNGPTETETETETVPNPDL